MQNVHVYECKIHAESMYVLLNFVDIIITTFCWVSASSLLSSSIVVTISSNCSGEFEYFFYKHKNKILKRVANTRLRFKTMAGTMAGNMLLRATNTRLRFKTMAGNMLLIKRYSKRVIAN